MKKKKQRIKVVNLEFDVDIYDKLMQIASLSDTTLNETISVLIATHIIDDVYHNRQPNYGVGLGDK